jgi:hypothetical protein
MHSKKNTIIIALTIVLNLLTSTSSVAEITKYPYVQNVTDNSIVIKWETSDSSIGAIHCNNGIDYHEAKPSTLHEVVITGLTANTAYVYNVISLNGTSTNYYSFTTAPTKGTPDNFIFAVAGDTQPVKTLSDGSPDPTNLQYVVDGIISKGPDILLHLGDIVSSGNSVPDWNSFFTHAQPLLSTTPIFPTPGNHEYNGDPGATNFFKYFSLPQEGTVEHGWYTFTYGNVRFISLDTQSMSRKQDAWLESKLSSATEDWIVVYFHQPPITSSSFSTDLNKYARDNWIPLFQKYGVNLVMSGHTHNYQRYEDTVYKTVYIVSGGGNDLFDSNDPTYTPPPGIIKHKQILDTIHYNTVEVDNTGSLKFTAYDAKGGAGAFDTFTMYIPKELHINSIVTSIFYGKTKTQIYGKAVVTIIDEYELPVQGATVTGNWTGLSNTQPYSTVTDINGIATFTTPLPSKIQEFGFVVDGVTASGMTWDPANR